MTIPLGDWCSDDVLIVAAHAVAVNVVGDGCAEEVFWATSVEDCRVNACAPCAE